MKKTLLLSVVASTMIMAGGDIAPVAPAVVAPAVSGWEFAGQAVVYYQTSDAKSTGDLFDQASSFADAGIKLGAVNKDLIAGIGAGVEVNGLATLGLENDVVSNVMQGVSGDLRGGWVSQAYLTYAMGNTSIKAGRQELPLALSPFAYSENWNVFVNTFDAVVLVNTDLPSTTLVGAWVKSGNVNGLGVATDMADFNEFNDNDGVFMLTAQNSSIENLTLTGTFYHAPELLVTEDVNILWADAKYNAGMFNVALQGGTIMGADEVGGKDTTAFGAMIGGKVSIVDLSLAYSSVDDGTIEAVNFGGVKTPLYTQMILNQNFIASDSDTIVARVAVDALGGKISLAYDYSEIKNGNTMGGLDAQGITTHANAGTYSELDLVYTTKVAENTDLFAGYVYQDMDKDVGTDWDQNFVRVWARYNF